MEPLDPQAVNLAKAIRQAESGGKFIVRSKDGSYGAYQFIKPTWDATSKKFGVNAEWDRATPEQQNEVAYKQIKEWKDKGHNVGEIASMWNAGAGKPQAYLEGKKGTNSSGVNYDVAKYAEKVATTYQTLKNGGQLPVPKQPGEHGFLGNLAKDVVKPFARLGTNVAQVGQILSGDEPTAQPFSGNFLGEVTPVGQQENFGEAVKDSLGTGLQIASNIPLSKSAGLSYQALKQTFQQGGVKALAPMAKNLAKEGALYGGAFSTGAALEEQKSIPRALGEGALGAGVGALAAPVIGTALPVLGRGFKLGKDIAQPNQEVVNKSISNLENKYVEWATGTKPGKKLVNAVNQKTDMLNKSGTTGKTPMRTLAEGGVVPNTNGVKFDTYDQAQKYKDDLTPLKETNRQALEEAGLSTMPSKIDEYEAKAISYARTKDNINSGRASKMEKEILAEFNILRDEYPDGNIPLGLADDIKSARWKNVFGNKGLIDADVLKKDSEYAIAKAFQKNIEEVAEKAGHTEVAQLNREIGDRLEAAKFLESLDGKVLKGGRVGKYVGTLIGSSLGQSIPGKIVGALGGNVVADILIKSSVNSPIRRLILRNLQKSDPEAYKITVEWLKKQGLDRGTRLQLPIGNPRPITPPDPRQYNPNGSIKTSKAQVTSAEKNPLSVNPKTGRFQTTFNSQSKSPTNQQTKPTMMSVSNISKTIPPNVKKGNLLDKFKNTPNKQGGFMQAYKGEKDLTTKILKDLEGKTTVSDRLSNEAKKYKSAAEFVKAQPVVYHGSNAKLKQFSNKQGTFFTDDYMNADGYASGKNVYEGVLNLKNPLIIDAKGKLHRELNTPYGKTTKEIVGNVDSNIYDGVIFKNIKDSWIDDADVDIPSTIYYAFKPKDVFLNESQLKEIWEKATKK